MTDKLHTLTPQWHAPQNVRAMVTTRSSGYSENLYHGCNLSDTVGDCNLSVEKNRTLLSQQLPTDPKWLHQTHSHVAIDTATHHNCHSADASFTQQPQHICVVLTADCIPILLCNQSGSMVAAIHAGWRGIANDLIQNTLNHFPQNDPIIAWLGPCICAEHYTVTQPFVERFTSILPTTKPAFRHLDGNDWLADLHYLATEKLHGLGIKHITRHAGCTYHEPQSFFSARRDGIHTGRMASLIWLA